MLITELSQSQIKEEMQQYCQETPQLVPVQVIGGSCNTAAVLHNW